MAHVSKELNKLCDLAVKLMSDIPVSPKKGSKRQIETTGLRSAPGGGGKSRAEFLDALSGEMTIMIHSVLFMVRGIADLFYAASHRNEDPNGVALVALLRHALEAASIVHWLLDNQVDGNERVRRYVIWRLNDLMHQRIILDQIGADAPYAGEAKKGIQAEEDPLFRGIERAGWRIKDQPPKVWLLKEDDTREVVPAFSYLVTRLSDNKNLYKILSDAAHASRSSIFNRLKTASETPDPNGKFEAQISSERIPNDHVIDLAVTAIAIPCIDLGKWNHIESRISYENLSRQVQAIYRRPAQGP